MVAVRACEYSSGLLCKCQFQNDGDVGLSLGERKSMLLLLLQVMNIESCIYLCDMLIAMINSEEYCKVRIMKVGSSG